MLRHATLWLVSLFMILASTSAPAGQSVRENLIAAADAKASGEYAFARCRDLKGKPFDAKGKKTALIVGDSYACDLVNAIEENAYLRDYQISLRYIPYDCQTVIGKGAVGLIAAKDKALCADPNHADSLERAQEQIQQAELVIFASRWKPEVADGLPSTLGQLGLKPQQKVVVVGNKFFGKITAQKYLRMADDELKTLRNKVNPVEAKTINEKLAKQLGKDVLFVNPHQLLCGDEASCPLFTPDLQLISYDGRHLTQAGARHVGKVLFGNSALGKM